MKVFVYGTLKEGYGNHGLLRGSAMVGRGQTVRAWRLRLAGFPVMMRPSSAAEPEAAPVAGEVYEASGETLERLDYLESEGRMYRRQKIRVRLNSGRTVTAWAYVGIGSFWRRAEVGLMRRTGQTLDWVPHWKAHLKKENLRDDHEAEEAR